MKELRKHKRRHSGDAVARLPLEEAQKIAAALVAYLENDDYICRIA